METQIGAGPMLRPPYYRDATYVARYLRLGTPLPEAATARGGAAPRNDL
jgi:hypothetical protein